MGKRNNSRQEGNVLIHALFLLSFSLNYVLCCVGWQEYLTHGKGVFKPEIVLWRLFDYITLD